jgi:hypothetical protein
MKKVIFALFLVGVLVLSMLPATVGAQAFVDKIRERIPVEGRVVETPDGCEDLIHTSGYINMQGHMTALDDGNVLLVSHSNPQDAVVEGMETGNIYHGVGNTQFIVRTLGPGETFHFTNTFMQVPAVGLHEVVHYTVNASGEVTAELDYYFEPGFSCS